MGFGQADGRGKGIAGRGPGIEKTTPSGALGWGQGQGSIRGPWGCGPGYKVECERGWGCRGRQGGNGEGFVCSVKDCGPDLPIWVLSGLGLW